MLLSEFNIVVWMTDGWPAYANRFKKKIHTNSKRYTQRIARFELYLRQHIAWLERKTLSFSKLAALHDKVIGYHLTLKIIHQFQSLPIFE